jgi:hypothetical protein
VLRKEKAGVLFDAAVGLPEKLKKTLLVNFFAIFI